MLFDHPPCWSVLAVLTSDCASPLGLYVRSYTRIASATAEQVGPAWSSGIGLISFLTRCPHFSMQFAWGAVCGKLCLAMPAARGSVEDIVLLVLTETDPGVAFFMLPCVIILLACMLPCAFSHTHCFLHSAPRPPSVSAGRRIWRKCCLRFAASAVRDLDPCRSR